MSYANCRVIAEFGRLNASADAFVCGSDVIWNPNFNNGLGAFFLDFAEKYKFSYAASFGDAEIDPQRIAPFAKALSELREIGLREQDGLRIVSALTDRPACVVADPVFLLTREDWERVAAPRGKKGGYIFTYTTHVTSEFTRFTEQLSKQTGLPVVRAVWDRSPSNRLKHGKLFSQSPERFLQQLRDADYVVTNSFHATALSLIFRKPFYTVVQGDKTGGINVRMADLLARTGMTDRIYNTVPERIDLTAPDFTTAAETLREMREEGIAFLQRNLDAAYEEKKQSHDKGA